MKKATNQPTPEMISSAVCYAKLLQDIQSTMWDAVIKRDRGEMVNWISVAKEIISLVEKRKR